MSNERIVLIDLDGCDEVEYRDYLVTRRQYPRQSSTGQPIYFFKIAPTAQGKAASAGTWPSAKEAIAAIDKLLEAHENTDA